MNVAQLIAKLSKLDPGLPVCLHDSRHMVICEVRAVVSSNGKPNDDTMGIPTRTEEFGTHCVVLSEYTPESFNPHPQG